MMYKALLILISFQVVFANRHLSEVANGCDPKNFRRSIVLFTEKGKHGQLAVILNDLSDAFRGMNYKPVISFDTCGVAIKLVPSFIQFGDSGQIERILDPKNPPKGINTNIMILGYFAESMLSSRKNIATGIDLSGRSSLVHRLDLDNHNEYVLAVLPRRNYNEELAKYVEWVQEQEFGLFEFQYTQEHLDDKTSMFLGSLSHLQSHYASVTFDKPTFYHLHRTGRKMHPTQYSTLVDLQNGVKCLSMCIDRVCQVRKSNPYACIVATVHRGCVEDKDCLGLAYNA